jgi:hypothetical protein
MSADAKITIDSSPINDTEKYPLEEPIVQAVDLLDDEDYRKLDKRVTRKIDLHILPWIIVGKTHLSHVTRPH